MSETKEKLSSSEAIKRLLQAINVDNKVGFYKVLEEYVSGLTPGGKPHSELIYLLRNKPLTLIPLTELGDNTKKLLNLNVTLNDPVFMSDEFKDLLPDILLEIKNKDLFRENNLPIRNKILLHGPTGNGKTTYAKYIAQEAELPYVEIKADLVIDSHIGSTSGNINKIFSEIMSPCVLFWDEIDSIGKKRGSSDNSAASSENERMVNSMLVNIEKLGADVIFVGATNRYEILDSAFTRRFDVLFEVKAPSEQEKISFATPLSEYYKINVDMNEVQPLSSYSDIKRYISDKARKALLTYIRQNL